ncbi:MAG: rhodanese-like domain-containing protein [Bacteroidota bacterium]
MFEFLKELISSKPKTDLGELILSGATIIDVRSKGEFQQGHLKGSINIPLKNVQEHLPKLKKNKPIIVCCASGARSGAARGIMRSNGFQDVHNGGAWTSLRKYM